MPSTPYDANDFAPPSRPPPPTVPEGWTVRWDNTYSRWFYVNLSTKQSQWEAPPGTVFPNQPPPYSHDPTVKSTTPALNTPRPEPYRAHSSPHPISPTATKSKGGLGSTLKNILKTAKSHQSSRPQSNYYTHSSNPYYGNAYGGMMGGGGRPMYGNGMMGPGAPMMMGGGRRPGMGMGTGGAAALGLGGGFLGGMMLNDAMNDEWRDGYQDAMQDQGDYGGGFDGGDFGDGGFDGGDFGGDF